MEALMEAFQNVDASKLSATGATDIAVVSGEKGLSISFNTTVDGKTVPVTLVLSPELEKPDGVADEVALGALIDKLNTLTVSEMTGEEAAEFMNEVLEKVVEKLQEKGLQSTTLPAKPGATNQTLFNLLEVLSLICEVAQEIKKVSKDIKASDNEMQAQAYERQASKTEAMAAVAKEMGNKYMIISVCMLAVSAAVSIGAGLVGAVKGGLSETKSAGVEADMSKTVMNSNGEVNMNALTTRSGARAGGRIGADRVDAIKNDFANNPGIANAKSEYQTAVNTQAAKATALGDRQGELAQLKANAGEHPSVEQQQAIDAKQGEVDVAQRELDAAKTATVKAKQKFVDAVMEVKGKYDSAYVNAPKAEQKAKMDEMVAANEFAMKTLKGTEITVGDGEGAQQQKILNSTDCGRIAASADRAYRANLKNENHYILSALASGGTFIGQLGQTLNQGWQSKVSYQAQMDSADAQREQAEASRRQKDYDESKGLEDVAQEVVNATRQTIQKAYESQHELTKEIFG
jgi:hypothetical protein